VMWWSVRKFIFLGKWILESYYAELMYDLMYDLMQALDLALKGMEMRLSRHSHMDGSSLISKKAITFFFSLVRMI